LGKKGQKLRRKKPVPRSLILLILQISFIHFVILLSFITLTIKYDIPLYIGSDGFKPTPWLGFIQFLYYGLPVLLAFSFAALFRPFWPQIRNLLVVILVVYTCYSVLSYYLRSDHLKWIDNHTHRTKLANFKIEQFTHRFEHINKAGLIDKVAFHAVVDASEFTSGSYGITGYLIQKGKPLPNNYLGVAKFVIKDEALKKFNLRFEVNPQVYNDYFDRGSFEVEIRVIKYLPVTKRGEEILKYTRWSPFFQANNLGWKRYRDYRENDRVTNI